MQVKTTSLLCSSTPPSFHLHHHHFHPLLPFQPRFPSCAPQLPFKSIQYHIHALSPLHSTATQETVETAKSGSGFVEVGYIASVHGLQGEICVKPSTDFPELRFSKPGRRWLRQPVAGKETIKEVELVEGRGHPGQKSWILRLEGIDSMDQARQLVGSTLLVREDDRPELEEGVFYTRDLIGMRVILKETGHYVGTVVNVFDSGANDLLQVRLYSSVNGPAESENLMSTGDVVSGPFIWVPFVEAIVPDVDMDRRELKITPPKGLLELNLRTDERSKKERRQLEWKERKKFQRRLIAAKKKLCELDQKHVFDGLRYGEKSERSLLADQIVGVNSKLLQLALQNVEVPSKRWTVTELINDARTGGVKHFLKLPKKFLTLSASEETLGANIIFAKKGLNLLSRGKVAFVLVVKDVDKNETNCQSDFADCQSNANSLCSFLQKLLPDQMFVKIEDRASVPLILVCQAQEIQPLKMLFEENDYFGFDINKVRFLEEEKLPVVSNSMEEQNRLKILMKSPWEILQSPAGSGVAISLLSSEGIIDHLCKTGVEYIEICSPSQENVGGNALLLGFANSSKAEVGIRVSEETKDSEETFDMIFSMNFIKSLANQPETLQFQAIPKLHSYVKMVDKEWIEVVPSSPNSYELSCTISSSLNACRLDKICVVDITE